MEITVLDKGALPVNTILSVRVGAIRRQMRVDVNKTISLPAPGATSTQHDEPIKIDLMSQLGSSVVDFVPEEGIYDVPVHFEGSNEDCQLKLEMRHVGEGERRRPRTAPEAPAGENVESPDREKFNNSLSTAMSMRSYLDHHNLVSEMQGLLQEVLKERPDDPTAYLLQRLEQAQRSQAPASGDNAVAAEVTPPTAAKEEPPAPATEAPPAPAKEGPPAAAKEEAPAAAKEEPPAKEEVQAPQETAAQPATEEHKDDDEGSESEGEANEMQEPPTRGMSILGFTPQKKKRREGVSAEATQMADANWVPPVYEKSSEDRASLSDMINHSKDSKLHMLFGCVQNAVFEQILDAMFVKPIAVGENVIERGAVGDYFYIVKQGKFDIYVKKGGADMVKVFEAGEGFAFGELALLYNAPRSATIRATEASEVWCLDRTAFRNLVVKSAEEQFKKYCDFLAQCDVFQDLDAAERSSLAEVFEEETFEDDEAIVEQGEKDNKMFILQSGEAVACIRGEQGEVEVKKYQAGDYFGEIALMLGEPRKASVYAVGQCTCLYISRDTFRRVLGPMQEIMQRNMDKYECYKDAIEAANAEQEAEPAGRQSCIEGDAGGDDGAPVPSRASVFAGGADKRTSMVFHKSKRDRTALMLENAHADKGAGQKEKEPTTLAEKVAVDFENLKLVKPTESFILQDCAFYAIGGLKLGQKHPTDKPIITRKGASASMTKDGTDEIYTWDSPIKLKNSISTAVLCQKGQKSACDPTPNQDNFAIFSFMGAQGNTIDVYLVCDGHGPFGHLVSFRLVQCLANEIRTSKFVQEGDFAEGLKQAFLNTQADLEKFAAEQDILINASGAAGSAMITEGQNVHIAFIGDARIFLGSWNRRDSRAIFCTKDHKPENPGEREMLEAAGSDVREPIPGCGSYRIYNKGSDFPGLTMSRAFGDTACDGVSREPEYHKFVMQPTDEWYAVVASDGVWEFLEAEDVCKLTAKKLRLKGPPETTKFLVEAARKRWNHFEGDYCDDITAILVQFNIHEKTSSHNHLVQINAKENDPSVGS